MNNVPLPRLLDSTFKEVRRIRPINLSLSLAITPLSYASIELPIDESLPARSLVELYSPLGSAGIFRVRAPQNAYGGDNVSTTTELEHAVVEVGDYLVRADYEEMMPAGTAMQTIFSHYRGSLWQLGSVSAMGTKQIAVQEKHTRVLEAMLSLLDQCPDCMMSFDFSTRPWTINIVKRETTVSAEGRLSRNVSTAKITYDDTDLCTRVYYQVFSKNSQGQTVTEWRTMDADTISQYGVVERDVSIDNGYTASEAEEVASEFLRQRKNPRVSVDIEAEELSQITGEAWDTFTVGKLLRLALPDYNTTIEHNITNVSWDDVYNQPRRMTVSLADEEDTAITFLHDLDSKGGSKGGGRSSKKSKIATKEYYTTLTRTDEEFEVMAAHVDDQGSILEQAGLYLDADGVLQYASDRPNMLAAHLQVNANAIEAEVSRAQNTEAEMLARLRVTESEIEATVKKGDVSTQLAVECGNVRITGSPGAANLVVDGLVTAEAINAAFAENEELYINNKLDIGGYFSYQAADVGWCSFIIDGVTYDEPMFLGTGDLSFSVADTQVCQALVSAAGQITGRWSQIHSGDTYSPVYTASTSKDSKSITVGISSNGWAGISQGHAGSCIVYATAGGANRAHISISGDEPYQRGYIDGGGGAASTVSGSWSGDTYTVTGGSNALSTTIAFNNGGWVAPATGESANNYTRNISVKADGTNTVLTQTISASAVYDIGKNSVDFNAFTFSGNTHIVTTRTMYANISNGKRKGLENQLLLDYNSDNGQEGWFGSAPNYQKYVFWRTAAEGTTGWSSRMRGTINASWVYNKGYDDGYSDGGSGSSPSISITPGTIRGLSDGAPSGHTQIFSSNSSGGTACIINGYYPFTVRAGNSTKKYYFKVQK